MLGVATLQETVTVSGQSPVIDTSATRIQTNYDQQQLASIPNARDMWSLLATTPSVTLNRVDVGGSNDGHADDLLRLRLLGPEPAADRRHQHHRRHLGRRASISTTARSKKCSSARPANSAEMPNPGVLTQFVGKSGGNTPSVSLYYDFENERHPEQATSIADQVRPVTGRDHPSGRQPPGQLQEPQPRRRRPDRARTSMWGYFAYLNQRNSVAAPPAGVILDGTPFNTKLFNYTGKGTYQMNQNNKFIGYLQHGTKQQPNRTDSSNRLRRAGPHHRAIRRCCRTRRAGSTRASGTARSARTCSPSSAPASSATTSASTATPSDSATRI